MRYIVAMVTGFLDNEYEAICITQFQVTQQGQKAVKYRRNVGSLSIDMSTDTSRSTYRPILDRYVD